MILENTRYMQYVATFTGTLTIVTISMYDAWPSPILPKIVADNSPLKNTTQEERSWIVSTFPLGHIPGSIIAGWTLEAFGRRGSLILSGPLLVIPWFVLALTSSVRIACIARFIAGVASAHATCAVVLYNSEVAEKEIRGRLGTTFKLLSVTGAMIPFCIGPCVSYLALTLISGTVSLISVCAVYFIPESPYHLVKIGREDDARKTLKRLLRSDLNEDDFQMHLNVVKTTVNRMIKEVSLWEFLSRKEYRKSLVLSLGIQTLNQLSGPQVFSAYAQTIIHSSQSSISPELSSIICGILQFPAALISAAMVDRAGRKPLLIVSSLGCGLALIAGGIYFYLQKIHVDISSLSWIPTSVVLLYLVMRSIGIGTLTWVVLSEIFSANIKGRAIGVAAAYHDVLAFIVAKSFEPVSNALGIHVLFGVFSVACILGALFIYFVLPETKGKTFNEIKDKLNKQRKMVDYDLVANPL